MRRMIVAIVIVTALGLGALLLVGRRAPADDDRSPGFERLQRDVQLETKPNYQSATKSDPLRRLRLEEERQRPQEGRN